MPVLAALYGGGEKTKGSAIVADLTEVKEATVTSALTTVAKRSKLRLREIMFLEAQEV
jgi:hypothetical protein